LAKRADIEAALRRIPPHEFDAIADHAIDGPGLISASAEAAAWLSLVAYAWHALTRI
jgi:hypothetical protein